MASVFLALAMEKRGVWINVFDHFPARICHQQMFETITMLIENGGMKKSFDFGDEDRYRIRYKK